MRKARGLTQVKLAKASGMSQPAISEIEKGETKSLMAETAIRLAAALETNPEWLETGHGSPALHVSASIDESELLTVYRSLSEANRAALEAAARALLNSQPTPPSRVTPYPKKIKQ